MIIAIDGKHSVGKSTIIRKLKQYYQNNNNVFFFKFPSNSNIARLAKKCQGREAVETMTMLYCADYYKAFNGVLAKNRSKIIVLDRYLLSFFVFQGYERQISYDYLRKLCKHLPYPDIQIVIYRKEAGIEHNPYVITMDELSRETNKMEFIQIENIVSDSQIHDLKGYYAVKSIIDKNLMK